MPGLLTHWDWKVFKAKLRGKLSQKNYNVHLYIGHQDQMSGAKNVLGPGFANTDQFDLCMDKYLDVQ